MVDMIHTIQRWMTVHTGDELRDTRGAALLWLYLCLSVLNVLYGLVIFPGAPKKPMVFGLLATAQLVYIGMFWITRKGKVDAAAFATGFIITMLIFAPVPVLGATTLQIITLFVPMLLVSFCARPVYAWILLVLQIASMIVLMVYLPVAARGAVTIDLCLIVGFALMMMVMATTLNDRFQRAMVGRLIDLNVNMDSARERAEHANKAKSLFLATMSHELRTPLSTMMGYTDLVCESAQDDELDNLQTLEDLAFVKHAGNHLLGLIDDVLDLSRVEAGQLQLAHEPIEIEELCTTLVQELAPAMKDNGNTLTLDCAAGLLVVSSDRRRVRQILLNLLSNAAKFTHQGEVTLRAINTMMPDSSDPAVRVDVVDTGIGLAPEDHARIFERFEQVDSSSTRQYGGTGLGLTLSMNLAEALQGILMLESELGKGSCFTLILPVMATSSHQSA